MSFAFADTMIVTPHGRRLSQMVNASYILSQKTLTIMIRNHCTTQTEGNYGLNIDIFINGRHYDTATGTPLADGAPSTKVAVSDAQQFTPSASHAVMALFMPASHSATNQRRPISCKPHGAHDRATPLPPCRQNLLVHKFAPHPVCKQTDASVAWQLSRIVAATRSCCRQTKPVVATLLPSSNNPDCHQTPRHNQHSSAPKKSRPYASSCGLSHRGGWFRHHATGRLLVVHQYAAFVGPRCGSSPGVIASCPGYTPSAGYRFDGPLYSDGQVSLALQPTAAPLATTSSRKNDWILRQFSTTTSRPKPGLRYHRPHLA